MADDERLAAEIRMCWEYWQLDARLQRLSRYIRDVNTGDADGPDCPMWLLERQRDAMRDYRGALETRAELMGVDLYAAAGEIREAVTWDDQSPAFVSLREYGPDAKQRLRLADLVLDGEAMGYVPNNPGREEFMELLAQVPRVVDRYLRESLGIPIRLEDGFIEVPVARKAAMDAAAEEYWKKKEA